MAGSEKTTFPIIPSAHWWALRKKFKQSIPGVVTDNYIASVLDMKVTSARANVLPGLRATKIIDAEGRPTELARRWRDDQQYPDVCAEIRKAVYPQDLLDGISDPGKHRDAATRWFANHTGGGEALVGKMVKFYILLSEADLAKAPEEKTGEKRPSLARTSGAATAKRPSKSAPKPVEQPQNPNPNPNGSPRQEPQNGSGPSVHINLQVHISADASTEQIDQVFASMAKHIYAKKAAE